MDDIKIYQLKRMDLRGATVIDGFPSVGLVSTITANYLISILDLDQIGILDCIHFPTVSVVRDSEPLNPVRIYGGDKIKGENGDTQLVVFISEFQPPPNLIKLIASTILDWMQEEGCHMLISPEGLVIDRDEDKEESEEDEEGLPGKDIRMKFGDDEPKSDLSEDKVIPPEEMVTYGIGSTENARNLLKKHDVRPFQEGVISGVAGVLLNEGKRRGFDVISILAEAKPNFPDARAAAMVIETVDKLLLNLDIDVKPLYKEAEGIEERIKAMQKQAKATKSRPPTPSMYG